MNTTRQTIVVVGFVVGHASIEHLDARCGRSAHDRVVGALGLVERASTSLDRLEFLVGPADHPVEAHAGRQDPKLIVPDVRCENAVVVEGGRNIII